MSLLAYSFNNPETFIKSKNKLIIMVLLTKKEIIQKLEQNKDKIKSFGVKKIILFGSYASGKAKSESDLDFLVEFEKNRGLFDDYIKLLHLLEDLFKKEVDLGEEHLLREELKPYILGGKKIEARI